ncbi:hypothetical protein Pan241w_60520 [Gimesia alba]|uniref:Uncharacterized protein n=1 Tax=Gimesia alba TaxID=2527973 RepID=A0A517RPX6_9PLAN|nr:hypothetical protein Pan241w_60520 [Gimesia alba]
MKPANCCIQQSMEMGIDTSARQVKKAAAVFHSHHSSKSSMYLWKKVLEI